MKGVKNKMIEVRMKKGEQIDRALRRLKKKLDKEGVLKEIRNRRHYEKPSEKRRRAERRPKMSSYTTSSSSGFSGGSSSGGGYSSRD